MTFFELALRFASGQYADACGWALQRRQTAYGATASDRVTTPSKLGNYFYVMVSELYSGDDYYKLYVLDVSTLSSPSTASSQTLSWRSGGDYHIVYISFIRESQWLYILSTHIPGSPTGNTAAHIFDISTPTSPIETYSWDLPSGKVCGMIRNGYVVQGSNHYIIGTAYGEKKLRILDISTVSTQSEYSTYTYSESPTLASYSNGYVYTMMADTSGYTTQLDIIDVTTLSSPTFSGTLDLSSHVGNVADTEPAIIGNVCWIVDSDYDFNGDETYNLVAIDISNPSSPSVLSSTPISVYPYYIIPCGTDLLYVSGYENVSTTGLSIAPIDISNPYSPSEGGLFNVDDSYDVLSYLKENSTLYVVGDDVANYYPELLIYSV